MSEACAASWSGALVPAMVRVSQTGAMSADDVVVLPMTGEDWPQVSAIYAAGIETGNATFESAPPSWVDFDRTRLPDHRFVAVHASGTVLGWVACARVSERPVYAGVVEHSVYVHPDAQGRGVGGLLLTELIASTETGGVWTIQSSLFEENVISQRLHERHGFRVVGSRRRIGRSVAGPHAGRWRSTILIERRSQTAGVD